MTTANKLTELKAQVAVASAEHREAARERDGYPNRQKALRQRVEELAHDGAHFKADGSPKAGTEAAKITAELAAPKPDYTVSVGIARGRLARAEQALRDHQLANGMELLEDLAKPAEQSCALITDLVSQLHDAVLGHDDIYSQIVSIAIACGVDGSDVAVDPRIEQLGKLQKQLTVEPLVAPYSRSITPRPGQLPPRVLNAARQGYIPLESASAEEIEAAGLTVKDRGFDGLQVSA